MIYGKSEKEKAEKRKQYAQRRKNSIVDALQILCDGLKITLHAF